MLYTVNCTEGIRLLEIHCAPFLLRSSVPPFLLRNCCTILDLCLKSEIMDGFWSSRCLNDRIDLPDKIGSFSSGATTSMVVKNGTKKNFWGFFLVHPDLHKIASRSAQICVPTCTKLHPDLHKFASQPAQNCIPICTNLQRLLLKIGSKVPIRARRALPALRRSEKEKLASKIILTKDIQHFELFCQNQTFLNFNLSTILENLNCLILKLSYQYLCKILV